MGFNSGFKGLFIRVVPKILGTSHYHRLKIPRFWSLICFILGFLAWNNGPCPQFRLQLYPCIIIRTLLFLLLLLLLLLSSSSFSFSSFFYWHYNTLRVLAFSVILFHSDLSLHWFLHRLIPIICISSLISTIHLFLGLPQILVPIGFHSNILLRVLLSSIRIMWPNQALLELLCYFLLKH